MKTIKINIGRKIPKNYTGIVEYPDGSKKWLLDGQVHRLDGPAIEWSQGTKMWYFEGKLHRENGPAFEGVKGNKEYWFNGKPLSECRIEQLLELGYPMKAAIKLARIKS